jgi:hypothetical protein
MEKQGQRVGLIVIDTLNRVMPGGNENAPDDMSAFIGHADAIAKATGAFVLIVHHSGKDAAKGARGHSSLRAAVDTELELKRDGEVRVLTLSKSREGEDGIQFAFRLEQVELGIDDDFDPISSCVAVSADVSDAKSKQPKPQGKWQECVYDVAKKLEIVHSIDGESVTREEILNEIKKIQCDLPQRWKECADRAIDELTAKKLIDVFEEALV